jgi:hypothetical protein
LTIDIDATLITAHSEKERAAGNYKHGYGFHPLGATDETREALAMILRPGNAGSNTAADHVTGDRPGARADPRRARRDLEILCAPTRPARRTDRRLLPRGARCEFSVGYELTEQVRAAILEIPEDAWVPGARPGRIGARERRGRGDHRPRRPVEPGRGSRVIVRRERPHPGAQLSFTDHDGYRFQAILTDQTDDDIAAIECRHRQHAHVEDRIRDDKDTGLPSSRSRSSPSTRCGWRS